MNKRQRRVFTLLRTKTKAIGLNRKELEGLALNIDKNLTLEENASDEEVDAAIEEAIDAALPFLEVSQSMAPRSIQTALQRRNAQQGNDDDDDDDDSDGDDQNDDDDDDHNHDGRNNGRQRGKGKNRNKKNTSGDSELVKLLREQSEAINSLRGEINSLKGDRVAETRREKLKQLVKDAGTFGKSTLKQFDRMTFKDEDEFNDYLDEVQEDLDKINQERADAGLRKLGEVPAGKGKKSPENQNIDAMSDEEIIALAGGKNENK